MQQKWEYLCISPDGAWDNKWEGEKISLQEFLNKKGREGWQLVKAPSYGFPGCIFKRPKQSP